jgi:phage/plasmid-like protein (TIGR03299 family)
MGIDQYGTVGGVDSMMSVRFTPWHGVSDMKKRVEFNIESGRQALTIAGIDWEVAKTSLGEFMPGADLADEHCVVTRKDNGAVLGVHRASYQEIQNTALADVADGVILARPGAFVESAGGLFKGKVTWALVRLPDSTVYFGSDGAERHERYILVSTSHDGSYGFTIRPTDVRVECMNTISMAWRGNSAMYKVRHTTNALDYVSEAQQGLAVSLANWEGFDQEIKRLLDTPLDTGEFLTSFVPHIIGERPADEGRSLTAWDEKFTGIVEAYHEDHNEAIVDTAWGAVNAFNEFEVWATKVRSKSLAEAQMVRVLTEDFPLTRQALALVGKG